MKNLFLMTLILIGVIFTACTSKNGYYDRANRASEKSLDRLEGEFK